MLDKQSYIWYLPQSLDARKAHAARLRSIGVAHVRVKAGGDDGDLWQQWSDPRAVQPYRDAGLRVTPWFYTWPTNGDRQVVAQAMQAQAFDEYALNPESEWRTDSPRNPWRDINQANSGATEWLRLMEQTLPSVRRAFSSVPSWTGFPYEAFCAGCHQAEPQHYWPRNMLADVYGRDYDEVGYHMLRGGQDLPCVPINTACGEYNDPAMIALAAQAFNEYPMIDGYSFWEANNTGFQWDAVQAVLKMLPDNIVIAPGPQNQLARSYIDRNGVPVTEVFWGGQFTEILGTDFVNLGIRGKGVPPENIYHQSLLNGTFQGWVLE